MAESFLLLCLLTCKSLLLRNYLHGTTHAEPLMWRVQWIVIRFRILRLSRSHLISLLRLSLRLTIPAKLKILRQDGHEFK